MVLVFANGDIVDYGWIGPWLAQATAVLAANGGTNHLMTLDHAPDVVIGDLDSLNGETRAWLEKTAVSLIVHPSAKDETDLELALLYAVEQYDDPVYVIGGFGGRFDQTLANILLLAHPHLQEQDIRFLTAHEQAWLVTSETTVAGEVGDTISLIPLGGDVFMVETTGLAWPLINEWLVFGPARGVSNQLTAVTATISIASGYLLCLHTSQHWQR